MNQKTAKLRTCASCEWIFRYKRHPDTEGCPICGFAHYGARFVYGRKAYRYYKTQDPFFEKKMNTYLSNLELSIEKYKEIKTLW